MRLGYIRWGKAGPSREEQETLLRNVGIKDFSADGPVYVDGPPKRRTKEGEEPLPQRAAAIASLRKGDELVIATATRLGTSVKDTLDVLAAITERGAVLLVASEGRAYKWHPDAAEAIDLAHDIEAERRAEITARARASAEAMKLRGGRKTKLSGKLLERAKAVWTDPKVSAREIAAELGVPVRTLYNQLGSRGTPRFGKAKPPLRLKGNSK